MGYEWIDRALDGLRGIAPDEVLEVLATDRRWPRAAVDPVTGVRVLSIWGRTAAGRPLIVAVRQAEDWQWQIVGARAMRAGEHRDFELWEERNDG